MYILGAESIMVNPTGRTFILQKLRLQWERERTIYIKQTEKPTTGSAQTQKSTGKVASKGRTGKDRETGRDHVMGREEEQAGRALPITEISGCLCLCALSHIFTQGFTLSQH